MHDSYVCSLKNGRLSRFQSVSEFANYQTMKNDKLAPIVKGCIGYILLTKEKYEMAIRNF